MRLGSGLRYPVAYGVGRDAHGSADTYDGKLAGTHEPINCPDRNRQLLRGMRYRPQNRIGHFAVASQH